MRGSQQVPPLYLLGRRIISGPRKGMAAQQASCGQCGPAKHAVALDSFHGVFRAGRHEATGMRKQRRNESLIAPQDKLEGQLHFCSITRARCAANRSPRATSSISSAKGKVSTLLRGLKTTSTGPSHACAEDRTASRMRRLIRLRSTDPPSTLPTVSPTRGPLPASGPSRRR